MKTPVLSDHAVIRYMERLRHVDIAEDDHESIREGRREVERILEHGTWSRRAPDWAGRLRRRDQGDHYYLLGDDICFIVNGGCAVTCIARGTLPVPERIRRNAHRSSRRYGKRKRGGH